MIGDFDYLDTRLMQAYSCDHFIRHAHDWETRLHGPNGEPMLAIEVTTYTPKLKTKRMKWPRQMIIRFEHFSQEELDYVIEHLGARDLRERGAGPAPPPYTGTLDPLNRLLASIRRER